MSITLLGVKMPTEALFFVVGLAGASTIGTQILIYAYVGQYYPMAIRSTGIGFASGVGRSGAILAPIVIGTLVGMALPLEQNFIAISIPAVIALIAIGLVNQKRSASACNGPGSSHPRPGPAGPCRLSAYRNGSGAEIPEFHGCPDAPRPPGRRGCVHCKQPDSQPSRLSLRPRPSRQGKAQA